MFGISSSRNSRTRRRRKNYAGPADISSVSEGLESRQLLSIDAVSVTGLPSTVEFGGTFQANLTVRNTGNTTISSYQYAFRLHPTNGGPRIDLVGQVFTRGSLSPGETDTFRQTLRLPSSLLSSTYRLNMGVAAGSMRDNVTSASAFRVVRGGGGGGGGGGGTTDRPDYVASFVDAPETVTAGTHLNRISYTIRNDGDGDGGRFIPFRVQIEGVDNNIERGLITGTLPDLSAGRSHRASPNITIPSDLPAGRYDVRLIVDPNNAHREESESNNQRVDRITVIGAPARRPDYVAASIDAPETIATSFARISYSIRNDGASGEGTVPYVIEIEGVDNNIKRDVGSGTFPELRAGQTVEESFLFRIPSDLPDGRYDVRLVVDPENAHREESESNNQRVDRITVVRNDPPPPPPQNDPDFVAASIDAPESITAGEHLTRISYSIRNAGGDSERFIPYRIEIEGVDNNVKRTLLTATLPELKAGDTFEAAPTFRVPSDLPAGRYDVRLIVDPDNAHKELSETNNQRIDRVTVENDPPPPAPGTLTASPSEIVAGDNSDLTVAFGDASSVQLFQDTNGNNRLDIGQDRFLAGASGNELSRTVNPNRTTTYFARARRASTGRWDNSDVPSVTVTTTPRPGGGIEFTPNSIEVGSSSVAEVDLTDASSIQLWQDSNGNGELDFGTDRFIAGSRSSQLSATVSPVETTTYLARVKRASTGRWDNSPAASGTLTVTGEPREDFLRATPDEITVGSETQLEVSFGDATQVQLFQDTNGNGRLDVGQDRFFAGARAAQMSAAVNPSETTTYFARAKRASTGRWDNVDFLTETITVTGEPIVTAISASPDTINRGDDSRIDTSFSDASVVQLFEDTNRNGRLDFGQDRFLAGARGNEVSRSVSPDQTTTYFSRAKRATTGRWDNAGLQSVVVTVNGTSVVGDRLESNDSVATATVIEGSERINGLSIHANEDGTANDDYFRFNSTGAGSLNLYFDHEAGDLDVIIVSQDTDQSRFAISVTDNESISLDGLGTGTFFALVYGSEGATNDYDIELELHEDVADTAFASGVADDVAVTV